MLLDNDIKVIRALAQSSGRSLKPLDVIFAENAHHFSATELMAEVKEVKRPNIYSPLYTLSKAIKAKVGVDCDSMLRDEIEAYLTQRFTSLFGNAQKPESIASRMARVYEFLSGSNTLTPTVLIRTVVGKKVHINEIDSSNWLNDVVLDCISDILSVNSKWMLEGIGPISPYYERLGNFKSIKIAGHSDDALHATVSETEVHFLKPVWNSLIGYYCLQKSKWKGDFGEFVTLDVVANIPHGEVPSLIEESASKHAQVFVTKPSASSWNMYVSGEYPLSVLFRGASIERYTKGAIDE